MKERKKNTAGTENRQGGGDKFIVMFDRQAMCVASPSFKLFFFMNQVKLVMLPDSRFVIKMSAGSSPA